MESFTPTFFCSALLPFCITSCLVSWFSIVLCSKWCCGWLMVLFCMCASVAKRHCMASSSTLRVYVGRQPFGLRLRQQFSQPVTVYGFGLFTLHATWHLDSKQVTYFSLHHLLLLFPGILEPGCLIRKHTSVYPHNTSPVFSNPLRFSSSDSWYLGILVSELRQLVWVGGRERLLTP